MLASLAVERNRSIRGPPSGALVRLRGSLDQHPRTATHETSISEAKLVVAALRRFEPFWPRDMDDMSRAELLAGIRQAIEHLASDLDPEPAPTA